MAKRLKLFLITEYFSIKQAMKQMSEIGEKTIFVTDEKQSLIGSLSDGDIRKWILSGGSLSENVKKIYNKNPKFVRENYKTDDVKKIMLNLLLESIPVVKNNNEVCHILTWEEIFSDKSTRNKRHINIPVVIMAGGKGTRLDPFTRILPKPLIPIGDKPIIEVIMDTFVSYGIKEFFISINHKAKMIKSYFEETRGKYKIHYVEEKKPLGTAGSLRLLKNKIKESFIVTNCDTIIKIDCIELLKLHKAKNYDMTIVVSCKHYTIPYGVCHIENGGILKTISEKPEYDLLVNTGMYIIKPTMFDLIPKHRFFNINELVENAKNKGFTIGVFPISENCWTDIGQWEEYRKVFEKIKIT